MHITPDKPDRLRIDLSDTVTAKAWARKLGSTIDEIAAAIEKVGNNAETVKKELSCKEGDGGPS